jgi:hypothetical protein
MQTLVVHRQQLTMENMKQLAEAGYSILDDPALLIFGRPAPTDVAEMAGQAPPPQAVANGHASVADELAHG